MFGQLFLILLKLFRWMNEKRIQFDSRLQSHYSPKVMTIVSCGIMFVIISSILFFPPYIGMSDDGSFSPVLKQIGLVPAEGSYPDLNYNYYVREYQIISEKSTADKASRIVVSLAEAAVFLDKLLTQDNVFDMRFMALLYILPYLFVIYLTVDYIFRYVSSFSVGLIVSFSLIIIFTDVSRISYLTSFYTQPTQMIALIGVAGAILRIPLENNFFINLGWMLLFCWILVLINPSNLILGLLLSVICIRSIPIRKKTEWRILCIVLAVFFSTISFSGLFTLNKGITLNQKYNAMTRGVLLQSQEPEDTLASFGIPSRYSILTDTFSGDDFPIVLLESNLLDDGFFNNYSYSDIFLYYFRHPGSLLGMLNIATQASFQTRPENSGNFEKSVGFLPKAKSSLWSIWSTFKSQSLTSTTGSLGFLALISAFLFKRKKKTTLNKSPAYSDYRLTVVTVFFAFILLTSVVLIIIGGDSELVNGTFAAGIGIDYLFLLFFSGITHRLNVLLEGKKS